jgi:hypothetical protein
VLRVPFGVSALVLARKATAHREGVLT